MTKQLVKRLRLAWKLKIWPWLVPWQAVKYLALDQSLTPSDIKRAQELAQRYGWRREGTMSEREDRARIVLLLRQRSESLLQNAADALEAADQRIKELEAAQYNHRVHPS